MKPLDGLPKLAGPLPEVTTDRLSLRRFATGDLDAFASEAARAALREAFTTLGLETICSLPQVENRASVRVAERIGMRRDRVATIPADDRRGAVDAAVFVMAPSDWIGQV